MTKITVGTEVTWNRVDALDEPLRGRVTAIDDDLRIAKVEGTRGWVHLSSIEPVGA